VRFPLVGGILLLKACLSRFASRSYLTEGVSSFGAHPSEALLVVCWLAHGNRIDVEVPAGRDCAAYVRAHPFGT
jgi:hypothetical protein